MGATGGHMFHPYEDFDLTFEQMKGIFETASKGFPKLKVTEKTDGQNIAIGYNTESGVTLGIRNMAHAKAGGLEKEALKRYFTSDRVDANKTPTPTNVVDSFYDAMTNFERVARQLPPEFFITQKGERIFYNAEVMDPRSANVIDYDTQVLLIHRVGHKVLSRGVLRELEISEAEQYSLELENRLVELQENSPEISTVKVNAIVNFTNFIEKKEAHRDAIRQLQTIQGTAQTVREYLKNRILSLLSTRIGTHYSEQTRDLAVEALMHFASTKSMPRKTVEVRAVLDSIPDPEKQQFPEKVTFIKDFLTTRSVMKDLVDRSMQPLMMVVHNFAAKLLEGFASGYTLQSDVSLEKLRKKVGAKAKELTDPGDLKTLETSLHKIHGGHDIEDVLSDKALEAALENITTSIEGLVFDYDGRTYKFTGQFAPINQMLGLGKFDRGAKKAPEPPPANRDDIKEEDADLEPASLTEPPEASTGGRTIALVPGAFKPPHAGHFEMVEHYSDIVGSSGLVYVLISPLSRGGNVEDEAEVTFEESKKIWDIYIQSAGLDNVIIYDKPTDSSSPVGQAAEYIENKSNNLDFAQPGDEIILGCSDKPNKRGRPDYERFGNPGSFQKYAAEGVVISDHVGVCFRTNEGASSATEFRRALMGGGDLSSFIPPGVEQERINAVFGSLMREKKMYEPISSLADIRRLVEEIINEVESEKQRRWACAQAGDNFKGKNKLTKAQAKEMCAADVDEGLISYFKGEAETESAFDQAWLLKTASTQEQYLNLSNLDKDLVAALLSTDQKQLNHLATTKKLTYYDAIDAAVHPWFLVRQKMIQIQKKLLDTGKPLASDAGDELEEISAMGAGGAVEISTGKRDEENDKKENTVIREDSDEQFITEVLNYILIRGTKNNELAN